ncbi:MAG: sulfatase-like hydrolase/transferase [Verrucomicrobia bacterium]|nr:sulfatase-like hydrolase/transferase [Verrucomicrobiota bacterium]
MNCIPSHPLSASRPVRVLVFAAFAAWCVHALAAGHERPHILFLLSDDHSYPFVSAYGDSNVRTPALDRFAAQGLRCHCFFTAAPQCVPSRAALLTGRSPVAARITRFSSPLARDEITFPEVLRDKAGYFTGVCGRSYHLDGSGARGGAAVGELLGRHGLRTFGQRLDYVNQGSDSQAVEQMKEFLDRRPDGRPFCLWLNFSDPHHPWTAPEADRPDPASLRLPAHWPDLAGVRAQLADYCAEVNRLDRSVGAVLEVLASRGLADKTLAVFCGDNGVALPHGKGSLYDPGCHVPFLVRWPGIVKPGSESRALLSGEDLAPTLLAAAGVPAPPRMTGVSFLPLLRGEPFEPRPFVFTERGPHGSASVSVTMKNSGFDLSRAVRTDRHKFIYNCTPWIPYAPVDSAGGAGWQQMVAAHTNGTLPPALATTYFTAPRPVYELYDLEADSSELANLSGRPDLAATERHLRLAMAEKMILDFDYLPLPAIPGAARRQPGIGAKEATPGNRARQFRQKDTNGDDRLSVDEFSAGRAADDARRWFGLRDANRDGFLSRNEFLPAQPPSQPPSSPSP